MIAQEVNLPKTTVDQKLKEDLSMRKVFAKLPTKVLMADEKTRCCFRRNGSTFARKPIRASRTPNLCMLNAFLEAKEPEVGDKWILHHDNAPSDTSLEVCDVLVALTWWV